MLRERKKEREKKKGGGEGEGWKADYRENRLVFFIYFKVDVRIF